MDSQPVSVEHERLAFGILREEMIDTLKSQRIDPIRNVLDDQILWGRSPVRLDLAGGWTDTPPYCIMEGGKVVNLSVELNGQLPLQVFARPLAEPKIILRSIDLGEKVEINSFEELQGYNRDWWRLFNSHGCAGAGWFWPRFLTKGVSQSPGTDEGVWLRD